MTYLVSLTDTASPTVGILIDLSPEEIVIKPLALEGAAAAATVDVRVHFPRLGFVVKPRRGDSRL